MTGANGSTGSTARSESPAFQPLPVYILAGGHSSRFGSDKARADVRAGVRGQPLILHLADALRPVANSITVVADRSGKYADLGLRTIADITPGQGPLGGLQAALADCAAPWLLAVSCDWVGLKAAWVDLLWQAVQRSGAAAAGARPVQCAVAFKGEQWEPLLALYHTSIAADVDRSLAAGQRSLWRLLETVHAAAVPLPKDWSDMAQVNTPEALAAWLAKAGANHRTK